MGKVIIHNMEELLDRVDRLQMEATRLLVAATAIKNGTPFEEAFDESMYCWGSTTIKDDAEGSLALMMHNIIAYKYSNKENKQDWWLLAKERKREIIDLITWYMDGSNAQYVINHLQRHLPDIYEWATGMYKQDIKNFKYLNGSESYIPEKCPWGTIDEVVRSTMEELCSKLPNKIED